MKLKRQVKIHFYACSNVWLWKMFPAQLFDAAVKFRMDRFRNSTSELVKRNAQSQRPRKWRLNLWKPTRTMTFPEFHCISETVHSIGNVYFKTFCPVIRNFTFHSFIYSCGGIFNMIYVLPIRHYFTTCWPTNHSSEQTALKHLLTECLR